MYGSYQDSVVLVDAFVKEIEELEIADEKIRGTLLLFLKMLRQEILQAEAVAKRNEQAAYKIVTGLNEAFIELNGGH